MNAVEEPDDERLAKLFDEFLKAADEGRDDAEELLGRAGELRARLLAMIELERKVRALARTPGEDARSPDAQRAFGRFRILGTLGKTGLSRVYLAHDPKLGRRIALKVLDRERILDKQQEAWIDNEARTLAQLEHPGVVRVYEVGKTDTHAYLAMELLTGPSLQAVIAAWNEERRGAAGPAAGQEPASEAARLRAAQLQPYSARIECLARLAEALAYCHDHGILHRDIKPANVLFDADGNPKLIDFGLAHLASAEEDTKLGLTEKLVGTAGYIAPEQVDSDRTGADPRSDQFVFGTVAYESIALQNPFLGNGRGATLDAIARADPPPLASKATSPPPDLARVIHHALARAPADRYPGMAALAADLRAILAHRPVSVVDPSLGHVARLWLRRHRRAVVVACSVLALALAAWSVWWITMTLGERDDLQAEISSIQPPELEDPAELEKKSAPLHELARRARAFDSSLLRTLFFGKRVPEVEVVIDAWSRRLAQMLTRDRTFSEENGIVLQDLIYRRLMWEEKELCPSCPHNTEGRERGLVLFPPKEDGYERSLTRLTVLQLFDPAGNGPRPNGPFLYEQQTLSAFRPTPLLDSLVAGTYRLQVHEKGARAIRYETEFHVPDGWPAGMRIQFKRPREELWKRSVPVQGKRYELAGDLGTLTIPSFRLLNAPISWAEFNQFLVETNEASSEFLKDQIPEEPAIVSFELAMRYAAWAGCRLPRYAELALAQETMEIRAPVASKVIQGEFVQDRSAPSEALLTPAFLEYADGHVNECPVRETVYVEMDEGSRSRKYLCFRLAFSTDDPELYKKIALEPIEK